MRGEYVVGAKSNGGVLMPSHTSGDPSFFAKKRAKEAQIGRVKRQPQASLRRRGSLTDQGGVRQGLMTHHLGIRSTLPLDIGTSVTP